MATKGQIVDGSILAMAKQRSSREGNARIKKGDIPEDWSENKRRRKDVDTRWTKKNGKSSYGFKNHVSVDVKHKLIRSYAVKDAALHDSNVFKQLLVDNTSKYVWADSAYRSEERLDCLSQYGFREHIQLKWSRNRPLTPREQEGNKTRSKVRSRVEHIFGVQA